MMLDSEVHFVLLVKHDFSELVSSNLSSTQSPSKSSKSSVKVLTCMGFDFNSRNVKAGQKYNYISSYKTCILFTKKIKPTWRPAALDNMYY